VSTTSATDTGWYVQFNNGSTANMTVAGAGNGAVELRRGNRTGTVIATTDAGVFNYVAGYYYIEVKITFSNTGSAEVRVNGTTVIDEPSLDTIASGADGWDTITLSGFASGLSFDDLYVLDGSGSELNDFLGDVRIDAHYPDGNGTTSNSTPSTGTNRAATVDETSPNSDTDYNTVTNVGDKDTLTLGAFANAGATPLAVQTNVFARKTDAGVGSACAVIRHSGTDYDGATAALNTTYAYFVEAYGLNPAGGLWTETDFNALEVGYKRTA
jgi:hypothetical protein